MQWTSTDRIPSRFKQMMRQQQKMEGSELSSRSDPTSDSEPGQIGHNDHHDEPPHNTVLGHHEGAAGPAHTPTSQAMDTSGGGSVALAPTQQPKIEPGTDTPQLNALGQHHLSMTGGHQQLNGQDMMHLGRSPHMGGHTPLTHDGAAAGIHGNPMNPHFNHPFSITNLMGPPDSKMDLKMYESMTQVHGGGGYANYGQISPMHTGGHPHMGMVKDHQSPTSMADGYYKAYTPHSTAAI